jgi:hypothetical protein
MLTATTARPSQYPKPNPPTPPILPHHHPRRTQASPRQLARKAPRLPLRSLKLVQAIQLWPLRRSQDLFGQQRIHQARTEIATEMAAQHPDEAVVLARTEQTRTSQGCDEGAEDD